MNYFRGELLTEQQYRDAFAVSPVFWVLDYRNLSPAPFPSYYVVETLECEDINAYPKLFGWSQTSRCFRTIHVGGFRTVNNPQPNYAFGDRNDCEEACMRLKLLGFEVKDIKNW